MLKDAAAAAVYGSRGANGVVMITTKRGGHFKRNNEFTLSSTYGVSRIRQESGHDERASSSRISGANPTGILNTATNATACANYVSNATTCDLVALDPTMRANLAAGVNTNWQDLMLRQGNLQNTQLGFSGGNANTRFRAGFGFLGQNSINIVQTTPTAADPSTSARPKAGSNYNSASRAPRLRGRQGAAPSCGTRRSSTPHSVATSTRRANRSSYPPKTAFS